MRIRNTALALLALMLVSSAVRAVPSSDREVYREALELYRSGMYERARAMFETLTPDAASEGYAVLCALKLRTDDYIETMAEYDRNYPSSALTGRIRFENARILFDEGKYGEASLEFSKVPSTSLDDRTPGSCSTRGSTARRRWNSPRFHRPRWMMLRCPNTCSSADIARSRSAATPKPCSSSRFLTPWNIRSSLPRASMSPA